MPVRKRAKWLTSRARKIELSLPQPVRDAVQAKRPDARIEQHVPARTRGGIARFDGIEIGDQPRLQASSTSCRCCRNLSADRAQIPAELTNVPGRALANGSAFGQIAHRNRGEPQISMLRSCELGGSDLLSLQSALFAGRLPRRHARRNDRRRRRLADDSAPGAAVRLPSGDGGRHRPALRVRHQDGRNRGPRQAADRRLADRRRPRAAAACRRRSRPCS